jgi:hypothetical protein
MYPTGWHEENIAPKDSTEMKTEDPLCAAVCQLFDAVHATPGMDISETRWCVGCLHAVSCSNLPTLKTMLPAQFMLVKNSADTAFNLSALWPILLQMLAGLVPTTGPFAAFLPILEAILAGLFPAPTPPAA